jgi:hypothetical protein
MLRSPVSWVEPSDDDQGFWLYSEEKEVDDDAA